MMKFTVCMTLVLVCGAPSFAGEPLVWPQFRGPGGSGIVEGQKQRIQAFEGVVIRRRRGDVRSNFTVRKISYGVGVEKTFPLHSPSIDKIELVTRGKVRRSRLYYLRSLRGKQARIKEAGK